MTFIEIFLTALSIILIIYLIFNILVIFLAYKLAKKYPAAVMLIIIILIAVATIETLTPTAIAAAIVTWSAAVTTIALTYKDLKKLFSGKKIRSSSRKKKKR